MRCFPIYFDIETSGLRSDQDRIVEIAAFSPNSGQGFDKLVHPGMPIPAEVSKIHGITDEMVADALPFAKIAEEFCQFCQSQEDAEPLLIAHNCFGFDQHFLRAEFVRAGFPAPTWRYLDSLKWARKYRPDLPRHGLQFLRQVYGVEANQAHRAMEDVLVLRSVFELMIDDLPLALVAELMSETTQVVAVKTMPFGKHQGLPLEKVPKSYLRWLQSSGALEKDENQPLKEKLLDLRLLI